MVEARTTLVTVHAVAVEAVLAAEEVGVGLRSALEAVRRGSCRSHRAPGWMKTRRADVCVSDE
jgi:hypothetical protein